MPSTHTTKERPPQDQAAAPRPTTKQLRFLRDLADRLGQTFTYPQTRRDASHEIQRLRQLARGRERLIDRDTARRERTDTRRDMAEQFGGATRFSEAEISGYGSSATWSRRS